MDKALRGENYRWSHEAPSECLIDRPFQLIYGYVKKVGDNDDKTEACPPDQGQGFFYILHHIEIVWDASISRLVRHAGRYSGSIPPTRRGHRLTEECLIFFNINGTYRKLKRATFFQKLKQQWIDVSSFTALVDMGMSEAA